MTSQMVKSMAMQNTRNLLSGVAGFGTMTPSDQKELFKQVYRAQCAELAAPDARYPAPAAASMSAGGAPARALADPRKASDMIDDKRHYNKRIEQAGQLAGEFIDEIDFPKFVRDLVKGVFDANLEVTVKQMEAFQKLLKTATKELTAFITKIDDTAAFGYLAENQPDLFSMDFPSDGETDNDGNPRPVLTDKDGTKLDLGDNEVKAKIMEAKIAMAREQRALLREVILMGVTRLVVEKGVIKASCLFDIKATEKIDKNDKAALQSAVSDSTSVTHSGGFMGSIFGGPQGGYTRSSQRSKISVSSAKSQATTDLAAKVAGSVEIQFKSDYFKLDNFAAMYGPVTNAPPALPGAPGQPAAAPVKV
jgi:hypothetical protein